VSSQARSRPQEAPKQPLKVALRESAQFIRRALGLVWKASAPLTVAFAVIAVVGSLLGPAIAFAGKRIVDSVVAAHHMDLSLSPRWAVVGQSQGGGAAIDTARWATEFSAGTGLDYRGVVATGTPAGIANLVKQAGPDVTVPPNLDPIANAYAAYIVAALREARPDLDIDGALTPAGRAAADKAETMCVHELADALADMTVPGFFGAPLASIPGFLDAVDDFMGTPASGFDRPIFLGVGLQDRDVPPELTLKFYDQLVANHQDVVLKVYPDQDHSGTVLASLPDSTPFLQRAFAG